MEIRWRERGTEEERKWVVGNLIMRNKFYLYYLTRDAQKTRVYL